MWLDVAVTDTLRMNVGESTKELVDVELDLEYWHSRLHFVKIPGRTVDSLWDKFLHKVKIDLILLWSVSGLNWKGRT